MKSARANVAQIAGISSQNFTSSFSVSRCLVFAWLNNIITFRVFLNNSSFRLLAVQLYSECSTKQCKLDLMENRKR